METGRRRKSARGGKGARQRHRERARGGIMKEREREKERERASERERNESKKKDACGMRNHAPAIIASASSGEREQTGRN